jgi:hypothetical protein
VAGGDDSSAEPAAKKGAKGAAANKRKADAPDPAPAAAPPALPAKVPKVEPKVTAATKAAAASTPVVCSAAAAPSAAPAADLGAVGIPTPTLAVDLVYSWCVEYAKSGRSTCHATGAKIDEGAVRIGKEVDSTFKLGTKMFQWCKPGPLFEQFRKGAESKPRIKSVSEIVGFETLKASDQKELSDLVEAEAVFRAGLQAAEADAEYFVHPEGKFWSILVAGSSTRVKWGKVGEEGVISEKSHADEASAEKFKDKMVRLLLCDLFAGIGAQAEIR